MNENYRLNIGITTLVIAIILLMILFFSIGLFTKSVEKEMREWQRGSYSINTMENHRDLIIKQKIQQNLLWSTVCMILLIFGIKNTLEGVLEIKQAKNKIQV